MRENPAIDSLIMIGKGLDVPDKAGMTPLHHAANMRDAKTIQALLAKGVNINALDSSGRTPLDILEQKKSVGAAIELNNIAIKVLKSQGAINAAKPEVESAAVATPPPPPPPPPLAPPPLPKKTPVQLVETALGKAVNYSTEPRPAMVNNGQKWVPDPGGKQDIVLVFNNAADAQAINQILKAPPYGIGGQGKDGMKVINNEGAKFTIKLSQDNIQAIISKGLDKAPMARHPAKMMQAAFEQKGGAPNAPAPNAKKAGAAGVGF